MKGDRGNTGPIGPPGRPGDGRPQHEHRNCELCNKAEIVECTRVLNFFVCMNCEINLMKRLKLILNFQ